MREAIPFIGDIFLVDRGIFQGTCVNKSLPVSDLNIQDNVFEVEVNLRSGIDLGQLNYEGAHVVIGVDVEIKTNDDGFKAGSVHANILKGAETVNYTLGIPVLSGQMKILTYRLVPIELLHIVNNDLSHFKNLSLDPRELQNLQVFQELNALLEEADNLDNDRDVASVMSTDIKYRLINLGKTIVGRKEDFLLNFTSLREMNMGNWVKNLHSLIMGVDDCSRHAVNFSSELQTIRKNLTGKISFLTMLKGHGIKYVSDPREFNHLIGEDACIAMFFNEDLVRSNPELFRKTFEFFKKLSEESKERGRANQVYLAVDLDVIPRNELRVVVPKKVVIYHYSKNIPVSLDLIGDLEKKSKFNSARCRRRGEEPEPKKRGKFKIPCPYSFGGPCPKDNYYEWLCEECFTFLDYGYNDCLYCNCGDGKGTNLKEFEFRCSEMVHGLDYVRYNDRCANYFEQITAMKNKSIIILGPSGVGKSTWINGMINYISYNKIETAKNSKIVTAIPTKFTVTDQYYQTQVIEIGNDENEDTSNVGASGTQDCRTYNIRYQKDNQDYNIQLIDTPGLGDSRGIDQDRKNVKKILDHIRYFDELHAFCILLKPNESKIGVLMKFCIKEILTNLHKSCINNIVYCFTNSRATFYRPGDTLPVLQKLLAEIDVHMLLNRDTIYCFDNESYRYLCTYNRKGVVYTKDDEKSFEESWDRSVEETQRLMDYIVELRPHRTQETLTLNQSRRLILSLTKPIADITHNIEMNIQIVSDHKKLIENMDEKDRNLLKNLFVPQVTLENVALGHPRTVCTAERCVEHHELDSGIQLTEFVTHCHPHCYLQNVTPETYPNPDLKHCAAMSGSPGGEWCHGCRCSWKTHQHILYDQRRTEIRVKNQNIEVNIKNKGDLRKQKEQAIEDLEDQVANLKEEKRQIIKIAGKFAYFLKHHAITAYNDCFGDYLDYLIDSEQGKRFPTDKDRKILDNLKKTKDNYQQEIDFLETAMRNCPDVGRYEPADVEEWKEELYNLPIHGKQLRENMKVVIEAEDKAARYNQKNLTAGKNLYQSYSSAAGAGSGYGNRSGSGYGYGGGSGSGYSYGSGSDYGAAGGGARGGSGSGIIPSLFSTIQKYNPFSSKNKYEKSGDFAGGNPNYRNHNYSDDDDNDKHNWRTQKSRGRGRGQQHYNYSGEDRQNGQKPGNNNNKGGKKGKKGKK